jgi:predicted aspartyl protease
MEVHSLTKYYEGIADVITSPVEIYNTDTGKKGSTEGIWDTGAKGSVITKTLAKKLGLFPVDQARVHGVHGYQDGINVYGVKIVLNNQNVSFILRVTECEQLTDEDSAMFLIGMDVISKGDFAISNFKGQTVMTFRVPSVERFDFSKGNKI